MSSEQGRFIGVGVAQVDYVFNEADQPYSTTREEVLPFIETHKANLIRAVREEAAGVQIVAVEQDKKSVPYDQFEYKLPVCLVVGHESDGVSKEVLDISDAIVELPMFGINKSLNVMVSLGIVLYEVIEKNT